MNRMTLAPLLLALPLSAGVRIQTKFEVKKDDFKQVTTAISKGENALKKEDYSVGNFSLRPGKTTDAQGRSSYSLRAGWRVEGGDAFKMKPGESLFLIVDGQRHALKTEKGSADTATKTAGVFLPQNHEWADYGPVEESLIRRIAAADNVRVKVEGAASALESSFQIKNFVVFEDFVAEVMDGKPEAVVRKERPHLKPVPQAR